MVTLSSLSFLRVGTVDLVVLADEWMQSLGLPASYWLSSTTYIIVAVLPLISLRAPAYLNYILDRLSSKLRYCAAPENFISRTVSKSRNLALKMRERSSNQVKIFVSLLKIQLGVVFICRCLGVVVG